MCCAKGFAADMGAWERAQESERRVVRQIMEYALRTWGWDLLPRALRLFSTRRDSPAALLMAMPVFDRWFAFTWVPNRDEESPEVPRTWPTAPLAVAWLCSGSARVNDFDRVVIMRATESPLQRVSSRNGTTWLVS